ncbi:hypothetical protein [uncultured Brevundimonas sp.]|uniref:hypothetical protein n=1 Tax=uncultured Brevundimonas sp. TaxID=213418 RepID=UPI0025E6105C|nr:hypothetical protein [uncultured Brevundimonas sp.]
MGVSSMKQGRIALAAALIGMSGAASAEAVRIAALRAPEAMGVAAARSIAIGRIGGNDGSRLGWALERSLAGRRVGGRPWFDLLGGRAGEARADMILDGTAITDVDEGRVTLKRRRCIEGPEDKCTKKGDVELDCTRRRIDVASDLRVVDGESGRIGWGARLTRSNEASWCPGESRPIGVESQVDEMLRSIADEATEKFAPDDWTGNVRFREGRKGMDKDAAERFKAAIRLTQRDLPAACAEFAALPDHPSTLYNRALCAEAADDYAGAERGYAALAQSDDNGDIDDSLARVRGTIAVRALIAGRGR